MKKVCTHPARIGGKCIDCGASVKGAESPKKPADPLNGETPAAAQETPENGQETPKKTTRKRKT